MIALHNYDMPWLVLVSYWLSVSTVHSSSHLGIMRFKRKIVIKLVGYSRSIRAQKERRDERGGEGRGGEQQRINAARNNNWIKYFAIWWVLKVSTSPGAEFQFRASTFRTFFFFCFACFSASMLMPLFCDPRRPFKAARFRAFEVYNELRLFFSSRLRFAYTFLLLHFVLLRLVLFFCWLAAVKQIAYFRPLSLSSPPTPCCCCCCCS